MPEETETQIRIPAPGEEGKHKGHKVRTIVLSKEEGISALYCVKCKKIITYIFAKAKGWTMAKAKKWVKEHHNKVLSMTEVMPGQRDDFAKIIAVLDGGEVKSFWPDGDSYIFEENTEKTLDTNEAESTILSREDEEAGNQEGDSTVEDAQVEDVAGANLVDADTSEPQDVEVGGESDIEEEKTTEEEKARGRGQGVGGPRQGDGGASKCVCPECGTETAHEKGVPCSKQKCPKCGTAMIGKSLETVVDIQAMNGDELSIVKIDKLKQIVYGVFLVPEKADHHGDVISTEDVEKVAHGFLVDYRLIDEMHKDVIRADIVESAIAWSDGLKFFGSELKKGTWFGGVKIHDKDVWDKVLSGEYKGFSVRIAGVREPIDE